MSAVRTGLHLLQIIIAQMLYHYNIEYYVETDLNKL